MRIDIEGHLHSGMAGEILDLLDVQFPGGTKPGNVGMTQLMGGAVEIQGAYNRVVCGLLPKGAGYRYIVAVLPAPAMAGAGGAVFDNLPQAPEGLAAPRAAL